MKLIKFYIWYLLSDVSVMGESEENVLCMTTTAVLKKHFGYAPAKEQKILKNRGFASWNKLYVAFCLMARNLKHLWVHF